VQPSGGLEILAGVADKDAVARRFRRSLIRLGRDHLGPTPAAIDKASKRVLAARTPNVRLPVHGGSELMNPERAITRLCNVVRGTLDHDNYQAVQKGTRDRRLETL
jgi:hypothetical protein